MKQATGRHDRGSGSHRRVQEVARLVAEEAIQLLVYSSTEPCWRIGSLTYSGPGCRRPPSGSPPPVPAPTRGVGETPDRFHVSTRTVPTPLDPPGGDCLRGQAFVRDRRRRLRVLRSTRPHPLCPRAAVGSRRDLGDHLSHNRRFVRWRCVHGGGGGVDHRRGRLRPTDGRRSTRCQNGQLSST